VGFATFFAVVRSRQLFSAIITYCYYKIDIAKIFFLIIQVLEEKMLHDELFV